MISRRGFGKSLGTLAIASACGAESAFAQRALVGGAAPLGTVWLNANEHPDGPCQAAMMQMAGALGASGRYHYQEFPEFYAAVARADKFETSQVLVGAGSSEILHMALEAFTSPAKPLIVIDPTFEFPAEVTKAAGKPVISVPLRKDYGADVKRLAAEADKAKGGLIYLCNPNNPTASITPKEDMAWLVSNLPAGAVLLVDEAYLHFADSSKVESALDYVRAGKNVIVARTFSKIYGMAGLRIGVGYAKPELIRQMAPYRNNVISYVSARAVLGALSDESLVPERRAKMSATRSALCAWLKENKLTYIEPHANFMMIDVGRPAPQVIAKMLAKGVAIGRPFPTYPNMIRVTIGSDQDMAAFRKAFSQVLQAGEA
jgi:histidinol-phosphate aminotransferase